MKFPVNHVYLKKQGNSKPYFTYGRELNNGHLLPSGKKKSEYDYLCAGKELIKLKVVEDGMLVESTPEGKSLLGLEVKNCHTLQNMQRISTCSGPYHQCDIIKIHVYLLDTEFDLMTDLEGDNVETIDLCLCFKGLI